MARSSITRRAFTPAMVTKAKLIMAKLPGHESASLWGLRSDDDAYLEEVAHELADDITDQLDATAVADMMAARPDLYPVES